MSTQQWNRDDDEYNREEVAREQTRAAYSHQDEAIATVNANAQRIRRMAAADDLIAALRSFVTYGCPVCSGDCGAANPPVTYCPMQQARAALAKAGVRT